jgi:hypothetical protein
MKIIEAYNNGKLFGSYQALTRRHVVTRTREYARKMLADSIREGRKNPLGEWSEKSVEEYDLRVKSYLSKLIPEPIPASLLMTYHLAAGLHSLAGLERLVANDKDLERAFSKGRRIGKQSSEQAMMIIMPKIVIPLPNLQVQGLDGRNKTFSAEDLATIANEAGKQSPDKDFRMIILGTSNF